MRFYKKCDHSRCQTFQVHGLGTRAKTKNISSDGLKLIADSKFIEKLRQRRVLIALIHAEVEKYSKYPVAIK